MTTHKPACLIPLPGGPGVSGVARFAVRLAGGLAERGHPVGLLLHAPTADVAPIDLPTADGVRRFDCGDLPPVEAADPDEFIARYEQAINELGRGEPCALVLGQHAAVFGIAASLEASSIRSIGVAHSDNGYDTRVLTHYEPILHAMVGVSDEIAADLHRLNPGRSGETRGIAYGVEIPDSVATREPIGGRPLRLLYAGRLEHRQKRVLALAALSAELDRRRIAHTLTIVGEGPARGELADTCQNLDSVTIAPPAGPDEIATLLDAHDAFVLPSRFEGLSIAMLEALAHGCIPVVAPSRSGTAQAVLPGVTGEIARTTPDDDERAVGLALADAVDALRRRDLAEMSRRCHARAAEHFGVDAHITHWSELLDHTIQQPPRLWPTDRPKSFDTTGGSVPADAVDRFDRVARSIGSEPIAIHGAGAHTRAIASALTQANIVCITDDDRQRHGETLLGLPIVAPEQARSHGAQHVIISTHLHEADVWRRRAVYENQGLVVHRLYGDVS